MDDKVITTGSVSIGMAEIVQFLAKQPFRIVGLYISHLLPHCIVFSVGICILWCRRSYFYSGLKIRDLLLPND